MTIRSRNWCLLAVLVMTMAGAAQAQPSSDTFLRELRTALRSGDRNAVAARIQYPIVVAIGGLRVPIGDAAALIERYDDIFTPALLAEIASGAGLGGRAGLAVQDPPSVDKVIVGNNALVITIVGGQLRITSITVPPPAPGGPIASTPGNPGSPPTRTTTPARVTMRTGPRPTQFSGSLLPGGTDLYLLFVPKGKLLDARLERVPPREALIHVVHAATGAPLNARTAGGARVVTGVALEGADYRIEVRRGDTGDAAPLPYIVSLILK